jgi:hypothetical protein
LTGVATQYGGIACFDNSSGVMNGLSFDVKRRMTLPELPAI